MQGRLCLPLGSLESTSLGPDVAMEGKGQGAKGLITQGRMGPVQRSTKRSVGQELMARPDLCPAESTAAVSDNPSLVGALMWGT